MAELINMPKLGFDMQEGQLVGWLKEPGDYISKGDIIAEIESDKATVEVEAFQEGTLLETLVSVDDWVPVGSPIAIIGEEGESVDKAALGLTGDGAQEEVSEPAAEEEPATVSQPQATPEPTTNGANVEGLPDGVRASPLARRMADEMGVDIRQVSGSGPQGRVVRADVEAFAEAAGEPHEQAAPAAPVSPPEPAPAPTANGHAAIEVKRTQVDIGPDDRENETSRLRKRIAERMVESKLSAPHFYVTTEVDMAGALDLRKELNESFEEHGVKISVNDMIVKAVALALVEYPNLNAAFNGESIVHYGHINVGIAVAVDGGLMNVVSKDADKYSLATLAKTHKAMIGRARDGKVKMDDLEGETFAVSNLGAYDVDHFIAILNPPNAGILAVGSAKKTPVVNEKTGEIEVGIRMKATVSADHRVTDGAEAAEFLRLVKEILEDPIRLMM